MATKQRELHVSLVGVGRFSPSLLLRGRAALTRVGGVSLWVAGLAVLAVAITARVGDAAGSAPVTVQNTP